MIAPKSCSTFLLRSALNIPQLAEKLMGSKLERPEGAQERSVGWLPFLFNKGAESDYELKPEDFVFSLDEGIYLIRSGTWTKTVESAVIKARLSKRIDELESKEARKVGRGEKKEILEAIRTEYLAQKDPVLGFVDLVIFNTPREETGMCHIYVGANSGPAEMALTLLRNTLCELPTRRLPYDVSAAMNLWSYNACSARNEMAPTTQEFCDFVGMPEGWHFGGGFSFESGSGAEKRQASFRNTSISDRLISDEALRSRVKSLSIATDEGVSFSLSDDGAISSISLNKETLTGRRLEATEMAGESGLSEKDIIHVEMFLWAQSCDQIITSLREALVRHNIETGDTPEEEGGTTLLRVND